MAGLPREELRVRRSQVVAVRVLGGYARGWCEEGHLAHVLSGESTLRIRDLQRSVRLRAGDTAIIPAGEAHRMEPAAGESIQILLFEQVC